MYILRTMNSKIFRIIFVLDVSKDVSKLCALDFIRVQKLFYYYITRMDHHGPLLL